MPAPFNITILEPNEYIQRKNILPVSAISIFEPSTSRFHPDGFFSEAIFGQVGSNERLVRRGYLDLRTKVISPHLYKQLMSLKGFYKDIISGKEYAVFDEELSDLVKTTRDDPDGETGYSFFLSCLPKIKFKETDSTKRTDKINLIKKYFDKLFIDKLIILPAGVRDVKLTDGKATSEEINKIYFGLWSLVQALPEQYSDDPIFDSIRYQVQNKVQQVYEYICNILDDKGGFSQSKYGARAVVYGNRNVITAAIVSRVGSSESPNHFSADEVMIPLFQAMKAATPLVVNRLNILFDSIFGNQTQTVPLINSRTLQLEYVELDLATIKQFATSEGLTELINGFRNIEIHRQPMSIVVKRNGVEELFYLFLTYENNDELYMFRSKDDFAEFYTNRANYSIENVPNLENIAEYDKNKVVIFGSTALRVFGMEHYNKDMDILVSDDVFQQIKKDSNFTRQENGVYRRNDNGIDVYNEVLFGSDSPFVSFEKIKKMTMKIGDYNFLSPEVLLNNYRESNRPKDINKIRFLESIVLDVTKIRPMTNVEIFYLATQSALKGKYATCTRHPVLNLEGISPFKIHLVSTDPSRVMRLKRLQDKYISDEEILPEYPNLDFPTKTSLSMHPSTLGKFGGDHDGDVLGLNILMSDEATEEMRNYMESPISMVDANGKLVYGLSSAKNPKFQFFATTYHSLE